MPGQDMKSSVPLQVSIYFNRYYAVAFFIVMLLLYIYKGMRLLSDGIILRISDQIYLFPTV